MPLATGSVPLAKTIGIVRVSRWTAIGARLDEISEREKVWTVPGQRMKAGKEHRVPLSARALAIVNGIDRQPEGEQGKDAQSEAGAFVFPGGKPGKAQSNMAFLMLLRRMKREDLTAQGFRSTFRTWAAVHAAPGSNERAYEAPCASGLLVTREGAPLGGVKRSSASRRAIGRGSSPGCLARNRACCGPCGAADWPGRPMSAYRYQ
jgi:hypothetical protein